MHKLRRVDRALDIETGKEILIKGEFGFLATADNENKPYGVPVNYVDYNDYIYIHSALM